MFGLSPWELLLVFLAILLLFGAKRLPEIGSSLGRGIREFKGSIKEVEGDVRAEITGDTAPPSAAAANQETAQARPANTES
ncbi:MAG: twin-arginine translocase TatA/TatE family subunit [Gemmatimonadales bacterium]|uniref:Sec-independent protein translocase subunit TatA/TatB n=1 Tax=Candidatus Palauibacter sp. TaxID=3101350 RepID=UPI0013833BC3|nr:twin-arginine translocase TatA/TatE family subunit [Gemmatimonadales bacterium]MYG19282.1 twin-arginine translocase TatA/TatE family subunit [Gemmatimonadales bacterium]MYH11104.1 twin-arginine translocase TatA/TatE family subunit [Gemmatimonadales bacterium]MYL05371.1 twin-arginine translocase TatA/TatE family subunit [Gemmatimonadales bacterium]